MSHIFSDTASVTSSTPFSPFSSAFSVSSEATVVSESGEADLGAFQSVFIALSQLQLHHSQETASHTQQQHGRQSTTSFIDDTFTTTRTNTPSIHAMSPLNLDPYTSSHPPSRIANRSASSNDTEARSARTERTVDGESDFVLPATGVSPSSAAEDGDEESVALTSPNSRPSSDELSVPDEDREIEDPRMWTFTEISPYPQSHRAADGTPESDRNVGQDDSPSLAEDGEGPSLGDLGSAFAFFAAERAKLAKQLELSKAATPISSGRELPGKKANKRGGKQQKKPEKAPSRLSSLAASNTRPDSDESEESKAAIAVAGLSLQPAGPNLSSSSLDDSFEARVRDRRGVLPRPPKATAKGPKSSNTSTPPVSIANANNRRRPGNHRHSRSLPIDPQTIGTLNASPTPASTSDLSRIQSLARRLTFQYPTDAPTLRRVIADPQVALGLGAHVTPSDDALVAGGFFDPAYSPSVTGTASRASTNTENALLYVFIDHSNILVGFLEWLRRQKEQGLHVATRSPKPKLSHAALVLLLERGRRCLRRVLVASSPLYQSLDEIAGMGYQISVLQRVEIKEGAAARPGLHQRTGSNGGIPQSASTSTLGSASPAGTPSRGQRRGGKGRPNGRVQQASETSVASSNGVHSGSSTESEQPTPVNALPPPQVRSGRRGGALYHRRTSSDQAFVTPSNSSTSLAQATADPSPAGSSSSSRPRFREEAVDELLQLKLLQTLLDTPSPPPPGSTIVLASGDAARSQFNPQGFLGCVRKALERGWNVEVAGWDEGRSRAYVDLVNEVERGELAGKMSIVGLDRWGLDLAEY